MLTEHQEIIDQLPYIAPFLFVDRLTTVTKNGTQGTYTFKETEFFYKGHFKSNPVTPGVILTECMAQIGVVCLGIYLFKEIDKPSNILPQVVLSSSQIDFYKAVFPGETVRVISERLYFRFGKLKCNVKMINSENEIVCKGTISGMLINTPQD